MLNIMMSMQQMQYLDLDPNKSHLGKLHHHSKDITVRIAVIYIVWAVVGTGFYVGYNGWKWNNAFYYAIQAGSSIGFGNVAEPNDDRCHVFTIFFILTYSSVIIGSLSVWIPKTFARIAELLGGGHQDDVDELWLYFYKIHSVHHFLEYIYFLAKYYNGWYTNPVRTLILWTWGIWILFGALWWSNYFEGETFIAGIYFAITACSTAGLYGPFCIDLTTNATPLCDLGVEASVFTGFYVLIGVPRKYSTVM
jgi:Ion channel